MPFSNRKELCQSVEKKTFLKAKRGWKNEIISKMYFFRQDHLPKGNRKASTDKVIPCWLVKSYIPRVQTAIKFGIKSWFVDMGLSTRDSILDLLPLFLTIEKKFFQILATIKSYVTTYIIIHKRCHQLLFRKYFIFLKLIIDNIYLDSSIHKLWLTVI